MQSDRRAGPEDNLLKSQALVPHGRGSATAPADGLPSPSASVPRDMARPQAPLRRAQLGPRAVGSWVPRLTKPAFEKFGFSAAALITDWPVIVGAALAAATSPERLKWPKLPARSSGVEGEAMRPPATLVLAVDPSRALDVQYQERQIVERINGYFGYRAVGELRIVQADIRSRARPAPEARSPRPQPKAPPAEVAAIEDEGLRAALARMAAGLGARA